MSVSSNGLVQLPVSFRQICSPSNLQGGRVSPTTAILTWDEPYSMCLRCPDAVGYQVAVVDSDFDLIINVVRPPCEISGLTPGMVYYFNVRAIAAGNNVSDSSYLRLPGEFPTFPSKPGSPKLSDLTDSSVTISWAVSYGGNITYRVLLNDFVVARTTDPYFTVEHLRSYTDYRVEVCAVNVAGTSEPTVVTFRTLVRPPTNLRFSHRNGLCRLTWDPVFGKYPSHKMSINGRHFATGPGRTGYYFMLADLSPGPVPHDFTFVVRAQLGQSFSEETRLEVTLSDVVNPSRPGGPIVSDITDSSATLTWEPSNDNIGVTGYRVHLNGLFNLTTPNTSLTINNWLISGAWHYVFVRAQDKDGNLSIPSPITVFKTTGQAPLPRPQAPKVQITPLTSTSVRLDWSFVDDEVGEAGVRIMVNDEHRLDVLLFPTTSLYNLLPGVEYSIAVSAFDILGQLSEPTVLVYESKDVTPPSIPGNLHEVSSTLDSVTLAWEESTDDVSLHGYVIYNNHEYFDSTPLTTYTAVDLIASSYLFSICALDSSGNASEPVSINVDIGYNPPKNFRLMPSAMPITLMWDAPDDMENIIDYTLTLVGPLGSATYMTSKRTLRPLLLPISRYEVTIIANNALGSSRPLITEFRTYRV